MTIASSDDYLNETMIKWQTPVFLCLFFLLPEAGFGVPTAEVRRVGIALERLHYSPQRQLDDNKSRKIFEQFVEKLDPEKVYFTYRDMNYLQTLYAHRLDDDIRSGTLDSAPKIYSHFQKRARERLSQVQTIVSGIEEGDLQKLTSRRGKDSEWCGTEGELRMAWKDKISGELGRIFNRSNDPENVRLAKSKKLLVKKYEAIQKEVDGLDEGTIKEAFLSSACQSYDPHSDYLGPEKMDEFDISMGLQLGGIGAVLGNEGGGVEVVSLVPGGPAAESGKLFKGDRIYAVGDCKTGVQDIEGLPIDKVVDLIRGEEGSKVCLEVEGETGGDGRVVELTRERVQLNNQAVKGAVVEIAGLKLGLIIIPSFYHDGEGRSVAKDAEKVIEQLSKIGVEGLVVDIRQDGGGVLDEAVKLAGIFIPRKAVVQIKSGDGRVEVKTAPVMPVSWNGPLVVLVDRYSASASEIFCGAIQDHGAGVIVGDSQTFGKGTVQAIMELERTPLLRLFTGEPSVNNGAVKVTVQKFYRATGLSTQAKGVASDIVIPSPTDLNEIGEATLQNHLPFDKAEALAISEGGVTQKEIAWLRQMSRERVAESKEFLARAEKLHLINTNPNQFVPLKGKILDTHNGVLSQNGTVVVSLRGGETETKQGALHEIYDGVPMPRFPSEDRDYSLEESLLIARDMVNAFRGRELVSGSR